MEMKDIETLLQSFNDKTHDAERVLSTLLESNITASYEQEQFSLSEDKPKNLKLHDKLHSLLDCMKNKGIENIEAKEDDSSIGLQDEEIAYNLSIKASPNMNNHTRAKSDRIDASDSRSYLTPKIEIKDRAKMVSNRIPEHDKIIKTKMVDFDSSETGKEESKLLAINPIPIKSVRRTMGQASSRPISQRQ